MTAPPPIYLDYAATTPCDPRVVDAMVPWLSEHFGNPSSRSHAWGWQAQEAVEHARGQVAALIGADPREIVWTSGATESNNLAIVGSARCRAARGRHVVTVATEHQAVLDPVRALGKQGFEATVLPVQGNGLLDLDRLRDALRPDTVLASVMLVNNEIGVVQDVAAIGRLCRERGILLHVDAAQATGKVGIDWAAWPVDLMSLTAHKSYGPKGIGALVVRREPRVPVEPLLHGGGQERGLRPGTLPTHQIVGMGAAFALAGAEMAVERERIRALRDRLLRGLSAIGGLVVNGDLERRVPHNLNVAFAGVDGEALLTGCTGLALSSGSACASGSAAPSHVLRALGCSDELAHASLRITIGRFTTEAEIDAALQMLRSQVARQREPTTHHG